MKFIWFCAALLFSVSELGAQDAVALVNKVKAKLDRVNDYQAEGKMKIDVSFIDAPESKVTIYYKKPDKFKVKRMGAYPFCPGVASVSTSVPCCPDPIMRWFPPKMQWWMEQLQRW